MAFILGLLIATASLVASIIHLGQSAASYYDFVGITMVIGGTIATAVITFPWVLKKEYKQQLTALVVKPSVDKKDLVTECLNFCKRVSLGNLKEAPTTKSITSQILKDGLELIQLGFKSDKIEILLKERLYQMTQRSKTVGTSFRSLAKYPPAFGLAGTVLGLVHLMRGVSDGMSPQETGVRMAIALVATFYGLLVANLVVNPIGEAISKNVQEEEKIGEIALQAVLLAADRIDLLESQEMLNSFVSTEDRVDFISNAFVDFEDQETGAA